MLTVHTARMYEAHPDLAAMDFFDPLYEIGTTSSIPSA